jgi:hypothetical protein
MRKKYQPFRLIDPPPDGFAVANNREIAVEHCAPGSNSNFSHHTLNG